MRKWLTFLLSPNTGQSFDRYVLCFLETSPITLEAVIPELIFGLILELTALNGHHGHFFWGWLLLDGTAQSHIKAWWHTDQQMFPENSFRGCFFILISCREGRTYKSWLKVNSAGNTGQFSCQNHIPGWRAWSLLGEMNPDLLSHILVSKSSLFPTRLVLWDIWDSSWVHRIPLSTEQFGKKNDH